jgi:hypothetical protein
MTKVINTAANGYDTCPSVYSGPGSAMAVVNVQNIAATQAQIYERLTGLGSDGGAVATGNDGHIHTEERNQPHIVFVSRSYGNENLNQTDSDRPLSISNFTSDVVGLPVVYVPFFVPAGMDDHCLLVVVHITGPGKGILRATLETWAGGPPMVPTAVTGSDRLPLQAGTFHPALADLPESQDLMWCRVYVGTSNQVHTLKLTTDLITPADNNDAFRELRAVTVMNEPSWGNVPPDVRMPDRPSSNLIDVGDSRNSNGWISPSTTSYPTEGNGPGVMAPAVRFTSLNDAWLQERAMGIPAGGQATATVDGHIHDGTAGLGDEIQIPVLGLPVGRWADASGTPTTLLWGNGAEGPETQSTTYQQVMRFEMHTPQNANSLDAAGTPRLWFAALMYGDNTKSGLAVKVTTLIGSGDETSAEVTTDAGLTNDYELVLATDALNFTSGGITSVKVEIKALAGTPSENAALVGLCFWVSP